MPFLDMKIFINSKDCVMHTTSISPLTSLNAFNPIVICYSDVVALPAGAARLSSYARLYDRGGVYTIRNTKPTKGPFFVRVLSESTSPPVGQRSYLDRVIG